MWPIFLVFIYYFFDFLFIASMMKSLFLQNEILGMNSSLFKFTYTVTFIIKFSVGFVFPTCFNLASFCLEINSAYRTTHRFCCEMAFIAIFQALAVTV